MATGFWYTASESLLATPNCRSYKTNTSLCVEYLFLETYEYNLELNFFAHFDGKMVKEFY